MRREATIDDCAFLLVQNGWISWLSIIQLLCIAIHDTSVATVDIAICDTSVS